MDKEGFDHKPSNTLQYKDYVNKFGKPRSETFVLGSRVGADSEVVTPQSLARAVSRGQTWSPFVFKTCPDWGRPRRLEPLFKNCQILAVDFDSGQTEQEIVEEAHNLGLQFNVIHHSFSSTKEKPKYRGILFLEEKLTDFEQTKKYNITLAHTFSKADKACVDAARLYFGSTIDSIEYLDNLHATPISVLDKLVQNLNPQCFVQSIKLNESKPEESEWGSAEVQRKILNDLPPKKRKYVKVKALGILKDIREYDGEKGSRYDLLWKSTSRLARMPEIVGSAVYEWVCDAVEQNPHFEGWDKNYQQVIMSAIQWSSTHSDVAL